MDEYEGPLSEGSQPGDPDLCIEADITLELLMKLYEFAPDAVYINDMEGTFLDGNSQAERLLGFKKRDIIGKNFVESGIVPPDQIEKVIYLQIESIKGDPTGPDEITLIRADGRLVHVEVRTQPITISDQKYVLGIARDISEREFLLNELERQRDLAKSYLDVAGVMILALDLEGRITMINKWGASLLGYDTPQEMLGKDWFRTALPEGYRTDVRSYFQALIDGSSDDMDREGAVICRDGSIKVISWHNQLRRDPDGIVTGTLSSGSDITTLRTKQRELKESEERFRGLVERSFDAICSMDRNGTINYISPAVTEILGYASDEMVGRNFLEFFPETEAVSLQEDFSAALKGKPFRGSRIPLTSKKGKPLIIEANVTPYTDESGLTMIEATFRDITDSVRMEKEMLDRTAFLQQVMDSINLPVFIKNLDGVVIGCNRHFLTFIGRKREDVMFSDMSDLMPEQILTLCNNKDRELLTGKGSLIFEVSMPGRDGSETPYLITKSPFRDIKGELRGIVSVMISVEEKKRYELELARSKEMMQKVLNSVDTGILLLDPGNGTVSDLNPMAAKMLDMPMDDVVGTLPDLIPAIMKGPCASVFEGSSRSCVQELEVPYMDGVLPVMVSLKREDILGSDNVIMTMTDMTDHIAARRALEESNDLLGMINRILRHDILNNLGMIQLALGQYRVTKRMDYIDGMEKALTRSVDLIEAMKQLEMIWSFGKPLKEYEMKGFIEGIAKGYDIPIEVSGDCRVLADDALSSVISNMISNAIKHGKTDRIEIGLEQGELTSRIRISDFGTGIPDKIVDKLFDEGFSYGSMAGSGLGLFIINRTMKRFGGSVSYEPTKPKGSTFVLEFRAPQSSSHST